MTKKKVTIFTLGGTISMRGNANGQEAVPEMDGQTLVESVPALADLAEFEVSSLHQIPGGSLTFSDMIRVAALANRAIESGSDGVVVVQGTDTIEESAFLVSLLVHHANPVVFTGAMRNASQLSADGPANLVDAIKVAISPASSDLGTLVVLNQEIHSAYFVRKMHTNFLGAFTSPGIGPLGWVTEGEPRILVRPARRFTLKAPVDGRDPAVALVTVAMSDDGRILSKIREMGFEGLVVEGLGAGHVPERVAPHLVDLAKQMPVILASRVPSGEVLRHTYGFVGSESYLLKHGLIYSGWLGGIRARVLLHVLLCKGYSREEIRQVFDHWQVP